MLDAFTTERIGFPAAQSDGYQRITELQRFGESIASLTQLDGASALSSAAAAGYTVCRGAGADEGLVRLVPSQTGTGRALVVWRKTAVPLIVGAPHPRFDLDTLAQSVLVFRQTGARALVVSGTHRCASTTASQCDGTTGACGGSGQPYPISDMAHVTATAFDESHRRLGVAHPEALVVSVHGASQAGVSVSDGTTASTDAQAPVARLATALTVQLGSERVSTCNAYPGAPDVEVRLCGTTNVQGRFVNGVGDVCGTAATSSSQRFLHVEQSSAVRARPEALASALTALLAD